MSVSPTRSETVARGLASGSVSGGVWAAAEAAAARREVERSKARDREIRSMETLLPSTGCSAAVTDRRTAGCGFRPRLRGFRPEIPHERDQRLDAPARKRVVDRRPDAADRPVPLQAVEPRLRRFR